MYSEEFSKFIVSTLPAWIWSGIIGLIMGAIGGGFIVIQVYPNPNPNPNSNPTNSPRPPVDFSPTDSDRKEDLEDVIIIVKDKNNKKSLKDVELEITFAKGLITGRTISDGTYRFEVPKQKLGEVKVLLNKQDYEQEEIRINFSVNPNKPRLIYLKPTSSETSEKKGGYPFQAKIKSNKEIYGVLEPIIVEFSFSNVPKNYRQFINIIKSSAPEEDYSNWRYVDKSGTFSFEGLKAGNYEIRAYIKNKHGNALIERKSIKVE